MTSQEANHDALNCEVVHGTRTGTRTSREVIHGTRTGTRTVSQGYESVRVPQNQYVERYFLVRQVCREVGFGMLNVGREVRFPRGSNLEKRVD